MYTRRCLRFPFLDLASIRLIAFDLTLKFRCFGGHHLGTYRLRAEPRREGARACRMSPSLLCDDLLASRLM